MKKGKIKSKLRYIPVIVALGATVACGVKLSTSVEKENACAKKIKKLESLIYEDYKDEEEANTILSHVLREYFEVEPSEDYFVNIKTATKIYKSLNSEKEKEDKNVSLSAIGTFYGIGGTAIAYLGTTKEKKEDKELKKEEEIEL